MKTRLILFLFALFFTLPATAVGYNSTLWKPVTGESVLPYYKASRKIVPAKQQYLLLNEAIMQQFLFGLPGNSREAQEITLPAPDGGFKTFRVWTTAIMEPGLAAKYPLIKAFTAVATDNNQVTAKISYTPFGFQAQVFDGAATYLIDPLTDEKSGYYQCYYKSDCTPVNKEVTCAVTDYRTSDNLNPLSDDGGVTGKKQNGATLKKYRLALACTHNYAIAVAGINPTKASVLAKMVVSVNRVNGIYERELAISMQLVAKTDTLIFLDSASDPYSNDNGGAMLGQNQEQCAYKIGNPNYDIGHVFSTGGGGIANLQSVCVTVGKAKGVTGLPNPVGDAFDVDFVAHEMGHQFGGNHTFNANTGSCQGNYVTPAAFEPGSGSTIMAYAGYCGSSNDLQSHSDAYFHAWTLKEITEYITTDSGAKCPVTIASGNTSATVPAIAHTYYVPFKTSFELTAPVVKDSLHDVLNYCWEEYDLGETGRSFSLTRYAGPIFRSFLPDTAATRVFPALPQLVKNITSYLGEKLPDTARSLNFKLTVRDVYNGIGSYNSTDDTLKLKVVNTVTPFEVTTPGTDNEVWTGGAYNTIYWNVSATDLAPISCPTVSIYLSLDSGYHFPVLLKANVANTGSTLVFIPNYATTKKARIKVKADNNVFFDMSNYVFTLDHNETLDSTLKNNVLVFPVPATTTLTIATGVPENVNVALFNVLGQRLWQADVLYNGTIPLAPYSNGIYFVHFFNADTKEKLVKPIVIAR